MDNFIGNAKIVNRITDIDLKTELINCYGKYSKFLQANMYLFDEYTDHSIDHINHMIKTSEDLIPPESIDKLNDMDIFVLLLSILYHDMGMHLSKEGVKRLIAEDAKIQIRGKFKFNDGISVLWNEYVDSIKKCDIRELSAKYERTLDDAFGEYSNTQLQEEDFVLRDFVRANHHVISHYIALNGFSMPEIDVKFTDPLYSFYHDMAGLVARSHGMAIRETFHYLKEAFYDDWKTPRGVHVIYLMVVLRLADYVHITADRVNPYKTRMHVFKSKRSELETKKHLYTYESHRKYDSPKTLFFTSEPTDAAVFFEMDSLIDDIQLELDTSWGILGEVYGHSSLELSLRRIDSNLKYKKWRDSQSYVTEEVKFKLDHRVLTLLIEPLYGSNPSYAFRELIQNSTDACRLLAKKPDVESGYEGSVTIEFCEKDENSYIKIKDNGIGMDIETLKNYFFTIGSSFRRSNNYKKESEGTDVVRNGKFGVGILTCFLLGSELEVKTKKYTSKESPKEAVGYSLKTNIDDQKIVIQKNADIEHGTEITITLNSKAKKALKDGKIITYEWFLDSDVKVLFIDSEKKENFYPMPIDAEKSNKETKLITLTGWNPMPSVANFNSVYWSQDYKIDPMTWNTFNSNGENESNYTIQPNLICNGIIIPEIYEKGIEDQIIKEWPTIYVVDPSGELDLDLSRYKLNSVLPFINNIKKEMYEFFVYQLLKLDDQQLDDFLYSFKSGGIYKPQKLAFLKEGYMLANAYFIGAINELLFVRIYTSKQIPLNTEMTSNFDSNMAYVFEIISAYQGVKYELTNCTRYNDMAFWDYLFMVREEQYDYHYSTNYTRDVFTRDTRQRFDNAPNHETAPEGFKIIGNFGAKYNYEYIQQIIQPIGLDVNDIKLLIINKRCQSVYSKALDEYFRNSKIIPYDKDKRIHPFNFLGTMEERFEKNKS